MAALQPRRARPPLRLPLLPLLLTAVSGIGVADAALVPRTAATSPDLRTPHALLGVIAACLCLPLYVVSIVLLWRRRTFFPIAGRGAVYLLTLAVVVLVAQIEMIAVLVAYPQGIPCGIQMMHALIFDYAVIFTYMFRGWILVFRLEIMNYLTETRWRAEKLQLLTQHAQRQQEARAEEQEAKGTAGDRPVSIRIGEGGDGGGSGHTPVTVDTSPIGGEFFLLHRSYIEPRVLLRSALSVYLLVVASVIMTMVFDPDVPLNNSYYHNSGQLPDDQWLGNDFTVRGFVTAPPCLPYSIKAISNQFIIAVVLLPFLVWIAWRLRINTHRAADRKKEKKAVQMLLRGVSSPVDGHQHDAEFDTVASKSNSSSSSSNSSSSSSGGGLFSASSSVDSDLDDTGNVKRELSMALLVMGASVVGFTVVGVLSIENQNWVMIITFHLLHSISVLLPLRLSFAISRKYRLMMGLSDGAGSGGSSGSSGRDGRSQLSHHRPYFTLQFILNHPATYPVLLTFLQKEYSSENALFWHEAKRFSLACSQLQRRIARWPAAPHEEGGEDVRSGGAASQHTLSHHRPAPHVASEQQLTSAPHPKQLDVHAGNAVAKELPFLSPVAVASTLLGRSSASEDLLFSPTSMPTSPLLRFGAADSAAGGAGEGAGGGGGSAGGTTGHTPARSASPSIPNPSPSLSSAPVLPPGASLATAAAAASPCPGANLHRGPSPSPSVSSVEMLQPPPQQPQPRGGSSAGSAAAVAEGGVSSPVTGPATSASVQASEPSSEHGHSAEYSELHAEAARIKSWCLKMHSDYLAKSAPFEINIPDDLSSLVHSQMALVERWQPTPPSGDRSEPPAPPPFPLSTLYMQTSVAIFNLIATDSFRRFLLTREFRQLLTKADEAQIAQAEKQAALQDTSQLEMDVRRIAGQVAAGSTGMQGQAHAHAHAAHSSPGGGHSTSNHSAAFATHNRRPVRSSNPQSQQLQPPQQRQNHSPLLSAHRLVHSPPSPFAGAPPSPLAGAAPSLHLPPSLPGSVQDDLPCRHTNTADS